MKRGAEGSGGRRPPTTLDRARARRWRGTGWQPCGVLTFLSDFGTVDTYVGIVHGVVLGIAPAARVIDLTHQIPPQSIAVGALLLRSAVEYFPAGTVHLAVVDPGVGSDRDPIIAVTERAVLVGPDNGLLEPSARALGLQEVRRIVDTDVFLEPVSRTFHARDIFAPVSAHLVAGRRPDSFGPAVDGMQSIAAAETNDDGKSIEGRIVHIDHFGNLISNISVADFGDEISVTVGGWRAEQLLPSYSAVAPGQLLALAGSWGTVEIACNGGSAAAVLGVDAGAVIIAQRNEQRS